MGQGMVAEPPCAICGMPSARVELVAPGELPAHWGTWPDWEKDTFARHYRDPARWHLLYKGPAAESGLGRAIDSAEAATIMKAFQPPLTYPRVHVAGFYDDAGICGECDAPYCRTHWHVSESGLGRCPAGHSKSLDPHWWPEDD